MDVAAAERALGDLRHVCGTGRKDRTSWPIEIESLVTAGLGLEHRILGLGLGRRSLGGELAEQPVT